MLRPLLVVGGAIAFAGSFFLARTVLHAYTGHGHLDAFHLVVAVVAAAAGVLLLRRAARSAAA